MPKENKIVDLIQSSTIHGVNHIYSATNRCFKVLWIFLFVFGIGGIGINLYYLLWKFHSKPVLINFTLDNEPFLWPDVTICNPAAPYFLEEGTPSFRYYIEISKKAQGTLDSLIKGIKEIKAQNKTDHEFEERTIIMSSLNPSKIGTHLFRNHITMVEYARKSPLIYYNRDPYMNYQRFKNLDELISTQIIQITNNYPCYTLHIDRSTSIKKEEIKSLQFYVNFNYNSYKLFNSSHADKAVTVYLSYGNEIPYENVLVLSPGYNHFFQVSQSRYIHSGIKRPCRDEIFEVELYDAMLQSTALYEGNQVNCKEVNSQRIYVELCKCYSPYLPIFKNGTYPPRLCFNATLYSNSEIVQNVKCMMRVYREQRENYQYFNYQCSKYQAIKCNKTIYKVTERKDMLLDAWTKSYNDRRYLGLKQMIEVFFGKSDINKEIFDKVRDNIIMFEIKRTQRFGDKYVEQNAYPFAELLSDIGGLMGLWLGLSVVGLFEIVEFLYIISREMFCMKCHKRKEPECLERTELPL